MSETPSVVVLGDMRDLHHHGCEAVIAQIRSGLADVGLTASKWVAGLDWTATEAECRSADLVLINGEGALHDSRPAIASILSLAEARRAAGKPTALINSSWFRNDFELTRRLQSFDLISVRDPQSRKELAQHGINCRLVPDLAVAQALQWRGQNPSPVATGFMVSDSTKPELTAQLRQLAKAREWRYLPVLARPTEQRPGAKSRKIHRRIRWAQRLGPLGKLWLSSRYHAHLVGLPTLEAYCAALAATRGVVTGRFHTVCLALGLEVPFLAVTSNTPKIESLLTAAGLDPRRRMIAPEALATLESVPAYDDNERLALRQFADEVKIGRRDLFIALHALAHHST